MSAKSIIKDLWGRFLPVDRTQKVAADGGPLSPDYETLKPNGQQKEYAVLSAEERAKGFVRPVRTTYRHVGIRPKYPLRDLTSEEHKRYDEFGYISYEEYPKGGATLGRFWTRSDLNSGCGTITTMGRSIAETYARDPGFYGATFCVSCGKHLPVGAAGEFVWEGSNERVGT